MPQCASVPAWVLACSHSMLLQVPPASGALLRCLLEKVQSVRTPAHERAQGVTEVFREANELYLFAEVKNCEHSRFCAFRDIWQDQALDSKDNKQSWL